MENAWRIAAVVLAVAAGLYVRQWLLKSQGGSVNFPFMGRTHKQ
jgi:hypothetical protein